MKKKLVVSTLAVSMAAVAVAGLPLSSKGLAAQFGIVGTASAATSVDFASLKERATKLYSSLTDADKQTLRDFRTELQSLSREQLEKDFAPVLAQLELSDAEKTTLFDLYLEVVSSIYTPDLSAVTDILKSPNYEAYQALLKEIGKQAGITDLSVEEVYSFIFGSNGVEQKLINLLKGKSESDLIDLIAHPNSELANKVKAIVLDSTIGTANYSLRASLAELKITKDMIAATKNNVESRLTNEKAAALVLAKAYYNAYLKSSTTTPTNPSTSGNSNSGSDFTTKPLTVDQKLAAAATYDVSKLVQVVDGKATVKLVDTDTINALANLAAAAKAAGKEGTALTLTLNLGTITAPTVEVPLSKAIVEAAKTKGIANIAVTFNGVTVTIPVSQFSTAIALTVTTAKPEVVTSVTKLKLASDVYEFALSVNGVATSTFKQPITIKLPLKNTDGLDKELLSVAKLVYGNLQFQGGVLDGEFIVEPRDTFSSYAVLENKVNFTDIASVQAWAGKQIQVVAAKGAIEGVGEGKFAPKSNVTRAEFAKMLIRALNLENNSAVQSFSDVSSTAWYAPYVAVAAEKGIITGRSAAKFDPNATITRAEMATMISRAVKSMNPAATTNVTAISQFSDAAKISASLRDGVAFAADHNLVIGNAGKFNPNDTATRAEAAVIIYRTINFK
ncbi:S-layer homology domain-containing protein [Paenibacillus etheri]|uniref:S-layer homology domain-containing protein n=1 Tax=Paenibacillus etheri TaxID=1306852 RepID=UPI001ADF237D|nr:S-layer homology domain-containing protein [Paenibacillus etheri]